MTVFHLIAFAGLAVTGACGGPKVTLRFRPPAGQTLDYMATQDMKITLQGTSVPGPRQQDMKMHFEYEQRVKGPAPNGTELAFRIKAVDLQIPGLPAEFRSLAAEMMTSFDIAVVYDERFQRQSASVTRGGEKVAVEFADFADGVYANAFPLPEEPVRQGQSWKGEIEAPFGRLPAVDKKLKVGYNVRLARIRHTPVDTIARFEIEFLFPPDPIEVIDRGTTRFISIAGTLKGGLEYSVTRSALVHSSLNGGLRLTSDQASEGTIDLDFQQDVLLMDGLTP